MVSDENQLIAEIIQTVPATVTGNVLTNDDPGKDGFGSPTITAISAVIDADTTSELVTVTATGYKVETNNGVLLIDKTTGDFSYTAAPGGSGHADTFTYTIQDAFLGDTGELDDHRHHHTAHPGDRLGAVRRHRRQQLHHRR